MSTIYTKKTSDGYKFHIERFDSAIEVAKTCQTREITDDRFNDKQHEELRSWHGVSSYEEAITLMQNGHQPTVDMIKEKFKITASGTSKRFTFKNNIVGFAPVVPLALKGVPNSMINMTQKSIKNKVIDVYYDITCSGSVSSNTIIENGQKVLGAIMELETQGYRFNLYAVQGYCRNNSADMMIVKVKSDTQPLDIKRISFPLCHTAFFRVIGFDWYSRVPGGTYRSGYGTTLKSDVGEDRMKKIAIELFGKNALYISGATIKDKQSEYIKEVLTK